MIPLERPDRFEIVNGPEDGTEFPITRSPVDVGADPNCAIHVRLDKDIRGNHARMTVVSEGYRVRWLGGTAVYVNGRRAGMIRSRIVRDGGVLQVGNTELMLCCASDGLASRSFGLPAESDLGWMVAAFIRKAALLVRMAWRTIRGISGRFFWWIVCGIALLALVRFLRPGTLDGVWYSLLNVLDWVLYYLGRIINGVRGAFR